MIALRSHLRPLFGAALILLPHFAAGARADQACLAAPSQACVFAWALTSARAERLDASLRIGAIMEVASGLARAGQRDRAAALFREVIAAANALQPQWSADDALALLAGRQARAGMIEEARALARGIAEDKPRAKAFAEIAAALVGRGQFEEAVAASLAIEIPATRSDTLVVVGRALADAGRAEEALTAARAIPEAIQRLRVMHKVADLLARERKPEADRLVREGIALARELPEGADQAIFTGLFAGALARLGHDGEAMALAVSITKPELRHSVYGPIASAQAEAGRIEAALATLKRIDTRNRERDNPVFARTEAMRDIVLALARAGRMDEAKAMAASMHSVNDYLHAAQRGIALAHAEAGRFDEAMAFAFALGPHTRDYVLQALAARLLAARRFDDALAASRALSRDYDRAPALAAAGAGLWKVDRKPAAEAAIREAISLAAGLPEGLFRAEGLVKIALLLPR